MRKRIYEYDIVRTIATFSVIFVHISAIAIAGYEPDSMQSGFMILLNRMLKFTTPVFIYLAGALIYDSNKKKPFDYKYFLVSRGKRILIPYAIVSLMYYMMISLIAHQSLSISVFVKQFLTGSAQYHLYFIPIILQLYLLTPVFLWIRKKISLKYLMPLLIGVSYICIMTMKFNYSDRIFLKFIVPYGLGLYFGSDLMTWMKNLGNKLYGLLVLILSLGIYYTYTHTHSSSLMFKNYYVLEKFRDTGWFLYCTLACILLTWVGMKLAKKDFIKKGCSAFSKISYYVYLLHPLFIYLTERVLNRLGIVSVSIRFVLTLIIVSGVSTLVAYVIKGIPWHSYYKALNKGKKVAVVIIAFVLGGFSMVVVYGELVDRGYISSMKSYSDSKRVKNLQSQNDASDHIYTNKKFGYTYNFDGFDIDDSNEVIKTTFINDQTIVDVYYENLNGTIHSSQAFTVYGNRSIVDDKYVSVSEDSWIKLEDYNVHLLSWSRESLKHLKQDYRYYVSLDIIKNDFEVYNITINSKNELDALAYLARFEITDIDNDAVVKQIQYEREDNPNWSQATKTFFYDEFVEREEMAWGIFEPSSVKGLDSLNAIEEKISYDFEYVLQYYDLAYFIDEDNIQSIYDQGKVLEFTLQTSVYGAYDPNFTMDVLNGVYDEEIDTIIEKVSRINGPVLFRLNNEMNGDWCFYNAFFFQKDTRIYTEMWQYFYDKFEEQGADNLIWVFNPNESSFPGFKWNHYSNYFPGKKYVDIIGVTGYNTGNFYNGEIWRDFEHIYDEFMPEYESVFKNYPFMITEFGTSTFGGDKEAWLNEMFEVISKYDFKAAVYWNSIDYTTEREKARIYKFDDDPKMIEVFKKQLNIK